MNAHRLPSGAGRMRARPGSIAPSGPGAGLVPVCRLAARALRRSIHPADGGVFCRRFAGGKGRSLEPGARRP
jgi:hypothetical protein